MRFLLPSFYQVDKTNQHGLPFFPLELFLQAESFLFNMMSWNAILQAPRYLTHRIPCACLQETIKACGVLTFSRVSQEDHFLSESQEALAYNCCGRLMKKDPSITVGKPFPVPDKDIPMQLLWKPTTLLPVIPHPCKLSELTGSSGGLRWNHTLVCHWDLIGRSFTSPLGRNAHISGKACSSSPPDCFKTQHPERNIQRKS